MEWLPISGIERDLVLVMLQDRGEVEVVEALDRVVSLLHLYKERGISQQTYRAAALVAIRSSREPLDVWPRLRPGEQITFDAEGVAQIPIWLRGSGTRPIDLPIPDELRGTPATVPWNWRFFQYNRQYLPYAFRKELKWLAEEGFETGSLSLDAPMGRNQEGESFSLLDVVTDAFDTDARLQSRDPALVVSESLVGHYPAIRDSLCVLERIQGFIPGAPIVHSPDKLEATWQYDREYSYYASGRGNKYRYTNGRYRPPKRKSFDYVERIAAFYQDETDSDDVERIKDANKLMRWDDEESERDSRVAGRRRRQGDKGGRTQ